MNKAFQSFENAAEHVKGGEKSRQFAYTVEIVLKDNSSYVTRMDDILYEIRDMGSAVIHKVIELSPDDKRRI
jgi:hypothetical protein